jgi:hypothetical protein
MFFASLLDVNCETGFAIALLAHIALGLRGNASVGRREGSLPLRLEGVFAEAKPRQKHGIVCAYGIGGCCGLSPSP